MRLAILPMTVDDISEVLDVDRESYSLPWPASAYRREIVHNRNAHYLVLREMAADDDAQADESPRVNRMLLPFLRRTLKPGAREPGGQILGYSGMWLMIDEAHITTIAMRTTWRGRGLGELLLASLVEAATEMSIRRVTLEVRVSNEVAQNLYRKYGFKQEGVRPRYYSDDNEDAYIMTTSEIQDEDYKQRFDGLVQTLRRRMATQEPLLEVSPGIVTAEAVRAVGRD